MATKKAPAKRKLRAKSRKSPEPKPEPGSVEEYESRPKILVYLSDAWPVEIQTKDWPILKDKIIGGTGMGHTTCYLCLRKHEDGRVLLYGYTFQCKSHSEPRSPKPDQRKQQEGILLGARGAKDKDEIVSMIQKLSDLLYLTKITTATFIATLPPEKLK